MNRGILRIKLLVAVLFATTLCNAQVKISTSQLNGTEWEEVSFCADGKIYTPHNIDTYKFNMSSYSRSFYSSSLKRTICAQFPFYITNDEPSYTYFDRSKVGVNATGKYIVKYNEKVHEVDYYTIMSFNSDEMVLFHKAQENSTPGLDVYLTLKRVNKNE